MHQFSKTIFVALALASSPVASAAVRYDLVAYSSFPTGPGLERFTGSFSYITPTFITPEQIINAGALTSCSVTGSLGPAICGSQRFYYPHPLGPYYTIDFGIVGNANASTISYLFAEAFNRVGTRGSLRYGQEQYAELTVTDLGAAVPSVPEPTSWAMLLIGFGLSGFALRKSCNPIVGAVA